MTRDEPGKEVKKLTLKEAGIDHKLSSRAQKLAAVSEDQFEGMLGEWRDNTRSVDSPTCYFARHRRQLDLHRMGSAR